MMTHEIITPLGRVSMLLDGREVEFDCEKKHRIRNCFLMLMASTGSR